MELLPVLGEAAEAFKRASQDQRIQFIKALFDSLRPSEKHALQKKLLEDNYYFDIFGSLPVEISLQIAELLDPKDVVLLRQVSRRWKYLLSSKQLAQNLIGTHYSTRFGIEHYALQITHDPFSAMRNLAFREYAGQNALFKLRTIRDLTSKGVDQDGFFRFLRCSENLRYVIFDHFKLNLTVESCQWYLVDLKSSPSPEVMPLINKQREILNIEVIHVGSHCVAGVTMMSRVLVWNMKGELIRSFPLMNEGLMSFASSQKYLCIRDEHVRHEYSDYYLLNLQTAILQVFENVLDFPKSHTCQRTLPSRSAMKILDHTNQIVLVSNTTTKGQAAVSWMTFNERDRTFREIIGKFIHYNLPSGMPDASFEVVFRHSTSIPHLSRFNGATREIYLEVVIVSETEVSVKFRDFSPYNRRPASSSFPHTVPKSFRYGDTVYAITGSITKRLSQETGYMSKHSLWCSKGNEPTPLGTGRLLNLAGMGGILQRIAVSEEGFLLFYDEGVLFYEWLDFDGFVELQKRTNQSELQVLATEFEDTKL